MKSIFYFIFLLISTTLIAQKPIITEDFSFSVGEKYKRIKSSNEYHFLYGQKLLSLKKIQKAFALERHTLSSLSKFGKSTAISEKGEFVSVLQLKDTVALFFRQKNKLLIQKLLISQPKVSSPTQFIKTPNTIADDFGFSSRFGYEAGYRINAFAIKKSVDGSKFVVLYKNKNKANTPDNKAKDVIGISVYNSDMSLDWKREMELPYFYKKLNTDDFMVDSKGKFYVLASVFEKERVSIGKRNKLDTDFHLELFTASKESSEWNISRINTQKSIEDAVLYSSTKNEPVLVGFYAEIENKGFIKGAFSAKINTSKTITPNFQPIPLDTLAKYNSRRETQINKGLRYTDDKNDLEDIHINKVVAANDGSFSIFAEQRYTYQTSSYVNGVNRVHYEFYYRNIYACKLDPSGKMKWFNQLPKNQFGTRGKQSMSFAYQGFKNHHYLLFWDTFDNLRKNIGDFASLLEMKKQDYMFVTAYKISDLTGNVEKLPVINSLEADKHKLSSFEMGKLIYINSSDLIMEAHDGRNSNYLLRLRGN